MNQQLPPSEISAEDSLANSWLAAANSFDGTIVAEADPGDSFISIPGAEPEEEAPGSTPTLSNQDRARLLSNRAIDANRWVRVGGRIFPILHLSIRDLETFHWATEDLETVMTNYQLVAAANELPFEEYAKNNTDLISLLLRDRIPVAAAVSLGVSVRKAKRMGDPLDLLNVAVEQWTHNLEMMRLQLLFPYPPEEDPEFTDEQLGVTGDPNAKNPIAMIDGLCQTYPWQYEEAISRTFPQIYLIGVSSSWKNYRNKQEMALKDEETKRFGRSVNKQGPKIRSGKVFFEGKFWHLKDMDRATNARYITAMLSSPYQNVAN